jgi:REP element-mobilizing transposase RayT
LTLGATQRQFLEMARKLRVQYPGAIYHVMSRGNRRERIFLDDQDQRKFLQTLGEACQKTGWQVHAYCLMNNQFHAVVETPEPNLVDGMKWFLGTYTSRFNRRHRVVGHLFSGRYKALPVDGSGNGYLKTACDYVHLNPERAKLLRPEESLRQYPWSSYGEYLKAPRQRPKWIRVDRLLGERRIPRDNAAGRREFERQMEERRRSDQTESSKKMRRGWYLGDEEFGCELLAQMDGKIGHHHGGAERRESAAQRAESILNEELKRRGWDQKELKRRRKADPGKVQVARRLRKETTMNWQWIAASLMMGAADYAAACVRELLKQS